MLPVAAAAAAAGSGGVGGGDASTARAAGSVAGAGVAAAAAGVGLPEQLRRLHIVNDLHARNAARIRKELSARELRMQPLDMWAVLKTLEPLRFQTTACSGILLWCGRVVVWWAGPLCVVASSVAGFAGSV